MAIWPNEANGHRYDKLSFITILPVFWRVYILIQHTRTYFKYFLLNATAVTFLTWKSGVHLRQGLNWPVPTTPNRLLISKKKAIKISTRYLDRYIHKCFWIEKVDLFFRLLLVLGVNWYINYIIMFIFIL